MRHLPIVVSAALYYLSTAHTMGAPQHLFWQAGKYTIDLRSPKIMGIVNVTPDSFSDGGQHATTQDALRHAEYLLQCGADILDIGGESTRPNAAPVSAQEELQRILPVIQAAVRLNVPISVDTYKPHVMQAALEAGADIINDIYALRWSSSETPHNGEQVIAQHPNCGVCLMHMHQQPQTMQQTPMPDDAQDAVAAVLHFLQQRASALQAQGVAPNRIALDVGIGFGKTPAQNLTLLQQHAQLQALGYPTLVGYSRKSTLGAVLDAMPTTITQTAYKSDLLPHQRSLSSVVAAVLAVERGAHIVRVHDVAATKQALTVWQAVQAGTITPQ